MSLGDGITWDETNPTNNTQATLIDDHIRDVRLGVRSRMGLEHEWPASQSSTAQGGQHKFITLQNQATKPAISGTQISGIYTKTVGSGLQEMFWENEAGNEVQITSRTSMNINISTDPSVSKAWVNFVGTSAVINGFYNVSSITRNGIGDYSIAFVTSFVNTAYVMMGNVSTKNNGAFGVMNIISLGQTAARIIVGNVQDDTPYDPALLNLAFYGSQ